MPWVHSQTVQFKLNLIFHYSELDGGDLYEVDSCELATVHSRVPQHQPSLAALPAQPKCFTSLLFALVLYLFDVLSFVLFNTTHKRVWCMHSQNCGNVLFTDWLNLLFCCESLPGKYKYSLGNTGIFKLVLAIICC